MSKKALYSLAAGVVLLWLVVFLAAYLLPGRRERSGAAGAANEAPRQETPVVAPVVTLPARGTVEVQPQEDVRQAQPTGDLAATLGKLLGGRGIRFRSLAKRKYPSGPAQGDSTSEALRSACGGVPVGGHVDGLDNGETKDVVLTDAGVYAGANDEVIKALTDLSSDDAEARADAATLLPDYLEDEKLEPIAAGLVLNHEDAEVRMFAAIALEDAAEAGSVDVLIRALDDQDETVRECARSSLGFIGGPVVLEKLKQARASATGDKRALIDKILEETLDQPLAID